MRQKQGGVSGAEQGQNMGEGGGGRGGRSKWKSWNM